MTTVQVLGILTLAEIIVCGVKGTYEGYTILLWVLYGFYRLFTS